MLKESLALSGELCLCTFPYLCVNIFCKNLSCDPQISFVFLGVLPSTGLILTETLPEFGEGERRLVPDIFDLLVHEV